MRNSKVNEWNSVIKGPKLDLASISWDFNDSVSSIKVPSGMQVEVYTDDNFGGSKWTFTADNANFGSAGCNDVMSSVKIIINK